jgi:hypothetical protein
VDTIIQFFQQHVTLDISGFVVGLAGLGFGAKQFFDARETKKTLKQTSADLRGAKDSIIELEKRNVTLAVSKFPQNLEALVSFVREEPEQELAIMCDFLGYAMYSNTVLFQGYLKALKDAKAKGVRIRLILYGLDEARHSIVTQLPRETFFQKICGVEPCLTYFRIRQNNAACPNNYNEFRDVLLRDEEKVREELGEVELVVIDHSLLAFAWIADQSKCCIFSLRNGGNGESGMTFQSRDTLVTIEFKSVFEAEWNKGSKPVYKGRW